MSLNQEVDALRRVPLFQPIEPRRLKLLAFTSERLVFNPGQDVSAKVTLAMPPISYWPVKRTC